MKLKEQSMLRTFLIISVFTCVNGQYRVPSATSTRRPVLDTDQYLRITIRPNNELDRTTVRATGWDYDTSRPEIRPATERVTNMDGLKDPCKRRASGYTNKGAPNVSYIPSMKLNAKPPIFVNETNLELVIPVQELIFLCQATFPIEWTFSENLGNELSIREGRKWENVNYTRTGRAREIYTSEISYKPPSTAKPTNLTCRSVEDTFCSQSTVNVHRSTIQRNQTFSVKFTHDYPKGKFVKQFSISEEGTNLNCSIKLEYHNDTKEFICSSKIHKNLTINVADRISPTNCYDPSSCGIFYNNENNAKCAQENHATDSKVTKDHVPFSLSNGDGSITPGVVLCKPDGGPEKISAVMPYFYSLPKICDGDSDDLPHLYVDVAPSSVRAGEFLSICPKILEVYKTDVILVYCVSSVYYFADGMQIKVKRKNAPDELIIPTLDTKSDDIKELGYRNYSADVHISDDSINAIECSAPIRKSTDWVSQESFVNVLEPVPLRFEGGSSDSIIEYEYEPDFEIKCEAKGLPQPVLTWSQNSEPLSPIFKQIGNSSLGWIGIIPPEENPDKIYGAFVCRAENRLKFLHKSFIVKKPDVGSSSEDETTNWYIWGIIVPLAVLIVVAVIAFLLWKILQQAKKLRLLSKAEIEEFMNGRPEVLNSQRSSTDYDVNSYAACLPYNRNYEVLKEHLEVDVNSVLGSGAYGMVLKGLLTLQNGERVRVAIKTVKPMDEISYFKALMSELKIMGFIGKHENIVNLLGAHTKSIQNREIFIAIEFCENGSLLNYLRDHRLGFDNYVLEGVLHPNINRVSYCTPSQVMSTLNLLRWGLQIANGMDFLYHKKVIHGDMAARNILLSQSLTAKIGDFGLSRQLFEYANYIKKHQSPLPWKWLALECLQDMKFSSKSDVWAYGITLWEIFSLGQSPYPGMSYNEEFMDGLVQGKRPSRPQYATKEIYSMMLLCWKTDPNERPSFLSMSKFFDETIRSIIPQEYVELQDRTSARGSRNEVKEKQERVARFVTDDTRIRLDFGPNSVHNSVVFHK